MRLMLIGYLIFIIVVALAIIYLASRLRIRFPGRFLFLILLIIASPVIISYFILSYFYPLPETAVPDVGGFSERDAVQKLESVGLTVHVEKRYEGTDAVTFQRPEPGRMVKEGRIVTLIIGQPKSINYLNPPSPEAYSPNTSESKAPVPANQGENK
jgi:hypothetical protein